MFYECTPSIADAGDQWKVQALDHGQQAGGCKLLSSHRKAWTVVWTACPFSRAVLNSSLDAAYA